jgi:hypothetical protein
MNKVPPPSLQVKVEVEVQEMSYFVCQPQLSGTNAKQNDSILSCLHLSQYVSLHLKNDTLPRSSLWREGLILVLPMLSLT